MGIPSTDNNDVSFATRCNFRPPNCVPEPVSMLPIPKDWVATQECVGEQVTNNEEVEIWDQTPTKDRWVWFAVDVEVRTEPLQNQPNMINVHQSRW